MRKRRGHLDEKGVDRIVKRGMVAEAALISSPSLHSSAASPFVESFECSVVIPFFNEGNAAAPFLRELREVTEAMKRPVEVVLVDDASTDATGATLLEAAADDPGWRIIRHASNAGQAAALLTGMQAAKAPILVILDGDGQNDPADIPALLARLAEGADMVMGVRAKRADSWLRRRMSRFANGVRSRILRDGVTDTGCGLKVFRREVVSAFIPIRTLYSFMAALAASAGFRVVECPVNHRPRLADESKYGLGVMLWRPAVDLLGVWWFTRRRIAGQKTEAQIASVSP